MNWKALLKTILHAAGGAAAAAGASVLIPAVTAHLDPVTAATIGSVVSSVISAHLPQPR